MMVGLEMVVLTERHKAELKVAGLQMIRFSLGVTSMDRIRNECIRGTTEDDRFGDKGW